MKLNIGSIIAALAITGFAAGMAWADNTSETVPFDPKAGGGGTGCPGAYIGFAKMTNTLNGTLFLTPATNAVNGVLTNTSGLFAAVYAVRQSDGVAWCGTNSVTFPVSDTNGYGLMVYIKTKPVPTNGQPISMQVNWLTAITTNN